MGGVSPGCASAPGRITYKGMKKFLSSSRLGEIIKFLISGGICFLIQFVLLVILRDHVGLNTLVAFFFAFMVSVVANYLLCVLWIWPSTGEGDAFTKLVTRMGFLITSGIGLLLNMFFMWLFGLIFGEDLVVFTIMGRNVSMYMINTCITTVIVLFWNYFTKRAVLQSRLIRKWALQWSQRKAK